MTLGEKIASARKEKGMTQEMLAEQLGGNTAGCGKVGNRSFPKLKRLYQIIHAYIFLLCLYLYFAR